MKIAFVSFMRMADWGGSEELWSKTALRALAEGHQVESLTCHWEPISPRIAKLAAAGVETKFYQGDSRAFSDRLAVKLGLKKGRSEIVPSIEADVYVFSNGSTWDFISNRKITDKIIALNKPFILLSHNTSEFGGILDGERREYAISVLQKASKALFVSEGTRKGAERQSAYNIPNAQIIGNPINIREAGIKSFPISDGLLMASVGSLECSLKGQDQLLESLSSEIWKKRDFLLKIYGKGPHNDYLHALIKFYGLEGKVVIEGHVSDVDRIWETNQVLILSSVTEGAPMVIVEAMLSGRAVLGTDVGGVDRYVQEGQTGFLVEVAKAKYLAAGLEKLWNNRNGLKQMGENAFHRASAVTDTHPEQTFLNIIESTYCS